MTPAVKDTAARTLTVLAIDPGNQQSAVILWNPKQRFIVDMRIEPNEMVLAYLASFNHEHEYTDYKLVVEMVESFGMPVGREVFETVFWTGRFCQAWSPYPFERIYRKEVKMNLCQSMRAKDAHIRQALIDRYGHPGVKRAKGILYGVKADLWSALACAVTAADKLTAISQTTEANHEPLA